jgi:hypothetical protein
LLVVIKTNFQIYFVFDKRCLIKTTVFTKILSYLKSIEENNI